MKTMLRKRVLSLLSMLVVLSMVFTPYTALATEGGPEVTDGDQPTLAPADRWIVQLTAPALAQYTGGIAGLTPTAISVTGANRLNVNTPVAQAYVAYLKAAQAEVAQAIQKAVPGAVVERDYQVVFNGMAIKLPQADEQAQVKLFKVPGIKQIFRQEIYYPDMYASLPLIGAPAMWANLGGQAASGEGLKVAVIDTGIYITNTCFTPTGYTYPAGFPKMDTDKPAATNEKVIAARAYFRPDDPPVAGDGATWAGPRGSSHSTHVGGTIACVPGTVAETGGYTKTISGVAPAAQLMSYRVFYPAQSGSGSGWSAELIAAIEDAVIDGADVVNNSWGGGSSSVYPDPIDMAYDAAWDAGVVVVFSAGNSGPYPNTTDHASDKDITVGASTTSGTIAAGRLGVSAPEPISATLQNMAYTTALFGAPLVVGQVYNYPYLPSVVADPTNDLGCNAWPAGTFTDKAALILRGSCDFSTKVYNAQQAGAEFVVVYNHTTGGDSLINMAAGANAALVTIPSVFIGNTNGVGIVNWYVANGAASELTLNNVPFQVGNTPDLLASFTSRGPSIRQTMGVDVVAPGVNIFSSGYGLGGGTTAHMGFGQASGTSMAAPHVSGAATLLKQLHPDWTPAQIKSALMSTAELDLLDYDSSVVGAADRGAGRIALNMAGDPGLTFDKPSLSYGYMTIGGSATETVVATDVFSHATTFTYTLTVEETGNVTTTGYFTLSVTPGTIAVDAKSDTASFDVNVTIAPNAPAGTYEGLVWLEHGPHTLHIPVWIQVWPTLGDTVLLLDNDFSSLLGYPDYTWYYTSTLEALGVPYDYYDADDNWGYAQTIPDLSMLQQYKAVIWYTGDHYQYNGYFTVATPLTVMDEDILIGYLQGGGRLLATGQDLAATLRADTRPPTDNTNTNLYASFLGAEWVQDDVFSGTLTTDPHQLDGLSFASSLNLDISMATTLLPDGAGNQGYVDEIKVPDVGEGQPEPVVMPEPIFQATSGDHKADGYTGLATSSDASLETPMTYADWRSVYLSFGFEGINNPPPETLIFDSRATTMMHLLSFLFTQPTVTLPDYDVDAGAVTLVATAGFATDDTTDLVQYRWDFGDNSPIQTTTIPTATHTYEAGMFTARVEVSDFYGHTAIDAGTVKTTAYIYLPLVMRNF